jgi:uncharacterized protein
MKEIVKQFFKPGKIRQTGQVKGKYYERSGSCNQCGQCCSNIYLVYNKKTIDSLEFFEFVKKKDPDYRSFEPMDLTGDEEGLLFRCQHLQPDKTCGIYEQRPELCRQYPSEYTLLLGGKLAKGCGYQFRLLKPFSQVLQTAAGQQTH